MNGELEDVKISFLNGYWFVFNENDIKITVRASVLLGNESIYVNDKLVSKKRSLKKMSRHVFDIGNMEYQVSFEAEIMKGRITCALFKNEEMVNKYEIKSKGNIYIKALLYALIGVTSGVIVAYFKWPFWVAFWIMALVFLLIGMREIKNVTIEREYS